MFCTKIDWRVVGKAFVQYFRGHTLQFIRSPRLDTDHYRAQEQMYADWIEQSGRAGVPAPNLMVACLLWLCGVAMAFVLPVRWLAVIVLGTLVWMMRGFMTAVPAAYEARSDDNPPLDVPLP